MVERACLPALAFGVLLLQAGCFQAPDRLPPDADTDASLTKRVRLALDGRPDDARTYAGLYAALASRLEANAYATTTEAAAVSGKAAEILNVPGVLKDVVNDELNPLLGTPQPLTPELAARAAAKLRDLSAACEEAAQ